MSPTSIPAVVMAAIVSYLGAYHLLLSLRRVQHRHGARENLLFALVCFSVAAYDIFCAGLYSAATPQDGASWQRLQMVTLAASGVAFLWFVREYTAVRPRWPTWLLTATYGVLLPLAWWGPGRFDLLLDVPAVKDVLLPGGLVVRYQEMASGPAAEVLGILGILMFLYCLYACVRLFRRGDRRRAVPLLGAVVLLFIAVFNDTMVSSGIYESVYLFEYAYLALVLLMTYFLSEEVIRAIETREALKQAETGLQSILENSLQGIVVAEDGRIVFANSRMCGFLGLSLAELRAMSNEQLIDLLHEEDRAGIAAGFRSQGSHFEFRARRKDGTIRWFELLVGPVPFRGKTCQMGVCVDITERKRLEVQLQQVQKMDALGQLAGGLAHDLNNLLSPVLGYAELLLMDRGAADEDREAIEEIRRAAMRARDVTRQLLTFGKKQVIEMKVAELGELLTGLKKMLDRTIREDIRFELRLAPGPHDILCDKTQIEQVVMNLVLNARDAMPDGGTLALEVADALVVEGSDREPRVPPGRYVRLTVSDTGVGMDAQVLEHVFEPFFTTKEVGKGTGLGLAMVYGIVEQHRGHISVASARGQGTTFQILLPQADGPAEADARPGPAQAARPGRETVLIVEDNEQVRNLCRQILERYGYRTLLATAYEECEACIRRTDGPVDLLLTDVIMPGMNGRDLYRRLSALAPSLRVLFMSGYADDVIAHEGVLEPGVSFLQKPFAVPDLLDKVRRVLEQ